MHKRGVTVLFVLALLTAFGALYQDTQFSSRLADGHTAAIAAERELGSLDAALASARTAQSIYVAGTQNPGAALTRVTELLDSIESTLRRRQKAAGAPEVAARYDAALTSLAEFRNVDVRARASLNQGDRLHAGDMVFIEGAQAADKLTTELATVRNFELQYRDRAARAESLARTGVYVLSLLLLVAVTAYLARALSLLSRNQPSTMAQMIKELPPPVRNGTHATGNGHASTATTVAPPAIATPNGGTPVSVPANAATAPAIRPATLAATAELCVDLARLLDGRDVPALLARASAVLDAKGIMIWSVDSGADLLRPSLAHGYGEKVLRKLQPLAIKDENITSQTFRTLQPQTMNGTSLGESMAIAVPLISGGGCVGVMAAEIRHTRSHADVMALARIIAAQFATILGPADDGLSKVAEA